MTHRRRGVIPVGLALLTLATAWSGAQTVLPASSLVFRSTGTPSAGEVTLTSDGYLGTYLTLTEPAQVQLNVQARGQSDAGVAPRLGVVVNDSKQFFHVGSLNANHALTLNLPAGTHFVRLQYDNDNGSSIRNLTIRDLTVTGASVSNVGSSANALAAADTYIANYRRGTARVAVSGPAGIPLLPGTNLPVSLQKHAFAFGTAVPGTSTTGVNNYLGNNGTARQVQYQARLLQNFNAIVPENAGKWAYNEATRDVVTMAAVDTILNYAQSNGLRARMHNLIWGDNSNNGQQPSWVLNDNAPPNNGLLNKAWLGDTNARSELRDEISERIAYYVGTGTPADRAHRFYEIDVYNESYHTGAGAPASPVDLRANYWNVYGAAGVADIYRQTIQAIQASGASTRVFVNEYNVLDDNNYANYYMDHIQAIRLAGLANGYGEVVQGIGAQYYPSLNTHNAHKAMTNFQSLAVRGLPITLTEFGVQTSLSTAAATTILGEMLRLTFGNPDTTGFYMWGFHQESGSGATTLFAPQAALYTVNTSNFNNWTITDAGKLWQDQLGIVDWDGNPGNGWTTSVSPIVDANGEITFQGYFGTYAVGGASGALQLIKGQQQYSVQLTAPPGWSFWNVAVGGDFGAPSNWSGGVPSGSVAVAHFGAAASPRQVTLNSAVTLGQLNLTGVHGYRLMGTGSLHLEGPAGISAIYVTAGEHSLELPVSAGAGLRFTVYDNARLALTEPLYANGNDLRKSGAGELRVERIVDANTLELTAGRLQSRSQLSKVRSLSIAAGATLDLAGSSAWIVDYSGESPFGSLRSLLDSGRNGGTWDGPGIASSAAAADPRLGVAMAEASSLGVTTFPGTAEPVDSTAVLLRVTLLGDATIDGVVNLSDFSLVSAHFNLSDRAWSQGDFTYDGFVTVADFSILAANYNQAMSRATPHGGSVPEPAAGILVSTVLASLLCRFPRMRLTEGPRMVR
ncbi:MAG: endo-1,4-beta-xylanase [Phycisphaerae bacterium]|nr:endo-1,4-beta-xylanase [Phycisphaerae bacterium]MDW8262528.1 endo-1,4-beta-xylanase [Phycisphaerales bacterium]